MSIFKRISMVIRSTINALIGSAEDPEKIMDTVIADLTENMSQVKLQVATAIKDEKTLERKVADNKRLAEDYQRKAEAALMAGDESLAVEGLKRKQASAALALSMEKELEEQKKVVNTLKEGVKNLENRIEEAKLKRNTLVAQKHRADVRTQLTSNVGSLSQQSALLETFDQMADKIAQIEDMSAATAELDEYANERKIKEAKLKTLEYDAVIAEDLAKLKEKVGRKNLNKPSDVMIDVTPGKVPAIVPSDETLPVTK